MYTILHISDLHRSPTDSISNDELLLSLLKDRELYATQDPPISPPAAIIVTGDLVRGVRLQSEVYPKDLEAQYHEALVFLVSLADRFLDGDRSRLIIIPGNHDVDWNAATPAMIEADCGNDIKNLLDSRNSPYRWDWKGKKCFQIKDRAIYDQGRFRCYAKTAQKFYEKVPLAFSFDPFRYWNLFELDKGRVAVAAFNSCRNNDCYCGLGEIPRECIAQADLRLRESGGTYALKIATWHHSVTGPPQASDYLDAATVKTMIPLGFRLGLHGHQHRTDAIPFSITLAHRESMVVVSAGSLCAGAPELPRGVSRQYNILEIGDDYRRVRVHVREMAVENVNLFTQGRLPGLASRSYVDVEWEPPIAPPQSATAGVRAAVLQAEELLARREVADAIQLLLHHKHELPQHGRRLLCQALVDQNDWSRIVETFNPPLTTDEVVASVKALAHLRRWSEAEALLTHSGSDVLAHSISRDLSSWLDAQRRMTS